MPYILWGGIGFLAVFLVWRTLAPIITAQRARNQRIESSAALPCRECGSANARFYAFRTCRCFGVAPIAATWEVESREAVLCGDCARRWAVRACRDIGLVGGWGFPGFIAVGLYTGSNLLQLLRNHSARLSTVLRCIAWGMILPWTMLIGFLVLLIVVLALGITVVEKLR